jgi:hypothetical protein
MEQNSIHWISDLFWFSISVLSYFRLFMFDKKVAGCQDLKYLQRIKIFQTNWTLIFHSLIYLNKNIKEIHINKQIMLITYFILPSCVCYCYYLYILNNCDTKLIFHSSHMQEIDSSVYHISFQCKNLFLKTF